MMNRKVCLLTVLVVLSSTNAQGRPFDMSGHNFFQQMGDRMQQAFKPLQNAFQQNQMQPWYNWNDGIFQNMGGSMQNMFQNMQNSFKQLVPWYQGANVCVDEQFHPDQMNHQMHAEEFGPEPQMESCQGNNFKYICMSSVNENGNTMQRVRKYECCQGFVRAEGPGCIPGHQ